MYVCVCVCASECMFNNNFRTNVQHPCIKTDTPLYKDQKYFLFYDPQKNSSSIMGIDLKPTACQQDAVTGWPIYEY